MDSNAEHFEPLRWVLVAATLSAPLFICGDAMASCWYDPNVAGVAKSIAADFPLALQRMPEVVVCDDRDFGPMIGGEFTAFPNGRTLIRLPAWQTGPRGNLYPTLAHELAHAEAHQQGLVEPFGGHGTRFMAALLTSGREQEAERVARTIAGADGALANARRTLGGQRVADAPPANHGATQLLCETVPRNYYITMPDDRAARRTVCELVCRAVAR